MASTRDAPSSEVLEQLRNIVGPKGWKSDPSEVAPHLEEPRGRWHGATPLAVFPRTTDEVAALVKVCSAHRVAIVPQGGNTGLVGGQIPTGHEVLLSLNKLNRVRALDATNNTVTVEAGCVLTTLQERAEAAGRLFPLSLASEGSCQVGGVISTNAGGNGVLRYGNMRDLVLGLEVVTPQGEVFNGLKGLRKDNTGYDLKQLYIGAEGTLGVVTAATCKLFPQPQEVVTGFIAVSHLDAALELFELARHSIGELISAFELISRQGLDLVLKHIPSAIDPIPERHEWYVLLEVTSSQRANQLRPLVENILEDSYARTLVADATLADSLGQRQSLWSLRESLPEAQTKEGASLKHDISVPVSAIPEFVNLATTAVTELVPEIRPVTFGHLGDGNLHFNLTQPLDMDVETYLASRDHVAKRVHDITNGLGGSISAEHGLGIAKRNEIANYKSPIEMALMRTVKRALDPDNIMNPGKVL